MKTLVIGATGKVGRQVVDQCIEQNRQIKAATRQPNTLPSAPTVEATHFDFNDESTYEKALQDVDHLFLIAATSPEDIGKLLRQGKSQLKKVTIMTAFGVNMDPSSPLAQAEQQVKDSGINYSILRPNWFMQNFTEGNFAPQIQHTGKLHLPAEEAKIAFIDTRDIAACAIKTLFDDSFNGREFNITGPEAIDHHEVMQHIGKATQKEMSYHSISEEQFKGILAEQQVPTGLIETLVGLFRMVREGYAAAVTEDVESCLGRKPFSFQKFAADYASFWKN